MGLAVGSAVFLLKSQKAIQPPQKATIFADGFFPFVRSIRVFQLCNSRGVGSAVCTVLIQRKIKHIKFCVEHGGEDRLLVEPQIDFETVPVSIQKSRTQNIRLSNSPFMVLILPASQHFPKGYPWTKTHA